MSPELVSTAVAVRAGDRPPSSFVRAFRRSTVFCRAARGSAVGVEVHEVDGFGMVLPVFSTLERLGDFAGECDWVSLTGADLYELLPDGVAVIVDPRDSHVLVVPSGDRDG